MVTKQFNVILNNKGPLFFFSALVFIFLWFNGYFHLWSSPCDDWENWVCKEFSATISKKSRFQRAYILTLKLNDNDFITLGDADPQLWKNCKKNDTIIKLQGQDSCLFTKKGVTRKLGFSGYLWKFKDQCSCN